MSIVCLSPAYVWDCEECGRENFQRAVSAALDPEDEGDAEVLREMHGLSPDELIPDVLAGVMMMRPNTVTCRHCNTTFKAMDARMHGEGEDDGE